MPSYTNVVKDTSPMLVYSANWRAGTSESDSSTDQYTQSSFTLTQTDGDSMSFRFFGTSIGVFGAKRSNHGDYDVQIDGTSYPTFNGQSPTSEFNQSLFSSNMDLGLHNLTIINEGSTFFDIDYVTFETNIGNDDEDLIVNTFKDTHPSFTYTPSSAWTTPASVGTFQGGSGHATSQPSSQATFTFQGDAVALYGPVGPNSTLAYSVQVDGGSPSLFSANKQFYRPQQMLFYTGNLGAGQHSLQIQLSSTSSGEFAIDYANVYTTPSLGGSFLAVPSTSSHLPPGTLAALAITTTLAILASLLCFYLFWRQRFELLHYSPAIPSKSESPAVVQPFVLSSAMERSVGSGGRTGPSEAPSQMSSHLQLTSIYTSAPPSTFRAVAPSTVGALSEVGTGSNSGYDVSSVQASGVLSSANAHEDIKVGDLSQEYDSQQRFSQPSAASSQYVGLPSAVHHPPPEYSRNPDGTMGIA